MPKISGRADDEIAVIKKRFEKFVEETLPVISHYEKRGLVVQIDASGDAEGVYEKIVSELGELRVFKMTF